MMPWELRSDRTQDEINSRLYRRRDLVRVYSMVELRPPEAVTLVRYRDDIQGRRVLDLGCGAGRLAAYLRPLTKHYVGLDVSEHMVDHCRQNFEELSFVQGDMRQLPFASGSFETVFGVFNLFDAVSHDDRLQVLAEVSRVLIPDGLLVFSSHNRNWMDCTAGPQFHFTLNPLSQFRSVMEYFQCVANRRRIKPCQRFESDYALLNDSAHNYAALHYYVNRAVQARQLDNSGFRLLECLDEFGRTLQPEDDDSNYSSIHYVARSVAGCL